MSPFNRCLHRPAKPRNGHKVFANAEGLISLCDWSGRTPECTDDGPLIVKPGTIVTVTFYRGEVVYTVPVDVPRTGGDGRVWIDTETMRGLSAVVPLRVDRSPEFEALRLDVEFAAGFAPAYC
jgi:hypothetical protein